MFQYFHSDPVTNGKWRIVSDKALTTEEIERQLKFVVASGRERPPDGQLYTLKWPSGTEAG